MLTFVSPWSRSWPLFRTVIVPHLPITWNCRWKKFWMGAREILHIIVRNTGGKEEKYSSWSWSWPLFRTVTAPHPPITRRLVHSNAANGWTEPYYWSISQMYLLRLSYLFVQIFKCICPKSKMCLFKFSSPPPEESSFPIGRLAANQRQVYNDRKWICQKVT